MHWAEDAEDANRIIGELAEQHDVRKVVKSKSMATEEIHLNHHLEATGHHLRGNGLWASTSSSWREEIPSHIVAPVIHKRIDEISELFADKLSMPRTLDPQALCARARVELRQEFLSADMGISGCNFAIAEHRHGLHRHQRRQRPHGVHAAAHLRRGDGHREAGANSPGRLPAVPVPHPQRHRPARHRLPVHEPPVPGGRTTWTVPRNSTWS